MIEMKTTNARVKKLTVLMIPLIVLALALPSGAVAAVTVVRDLPQDPTYSGDEINVILNQSGFLIDTGIVTEVLPPGFEYLQGSLQSDRVGYYDQETNELQILFKGDKTMLYKVRSGTTDQIEAAAFSGSWQTLDQMLNELSGEVEGDTTLTLGTGPRPTPTPTPSNGGGGGGGNGGGGETTPTSTTSPAPTTSISPSPSASPGVSPTPSSGPTASPGATTTPASPTPTAGSTTSPSASPTAKPGIPGFELIFALAGLLAVAQWLWWRRSS